MFGGATGQVLEMLKQEIPSLKCVNFDIPQVIAALKPNPNIEMVAGSFFDVTTMPKCDVVFSKYILHDWGDVECLKLMTNAHQVLSDDGLFISVNYDMPEPGDKVPTTFVQGLDLEMMMLCNAKERTLPEYKALHKKAGF